MPTWYNLAMPSSRDFTGISRAKLNGLRTELKKWGVVIPEGDDVDVKGPFGVKLRATYEEPSETLRLVITDRPALISEGQIWKVVENGADKLA